MVLSGTGLVPKGADSGVAISPDGPSASDAGLRGEGDVPAANSMLPRYKELTNYSDVVVLRNTNSPVSTELVDYFVSQRDVPPQNVCDIATATTETINDATFATLRADVEDCLTSRGLVTTTNFLVTTKGFPLRVTVSGQPWTYRASVDSELSVILGPYAGFIHGNYWVESPYFNASAPFSRSTYGYYIVTRLTGFTTEEAKGLLDRATAGIGRKGRFVLDLDPLKGGAYVVGNDWMRVAADILTAKGFDVFLDQNNSFVTGQTGVAGYTSWGSNDADWYANQNANVGFETDDDGDEVPDGWAEVEEGGIGLVTRDSFDFQAGSWSVRVFRNGAVPGSTYIYQDVTPLPGTRYFARGQANLSSVSPEGGAHLQLAAVDGSGAVLRTYNGSMRTGTTSNWVALGQAIYEPVPGAEKLRIAAVLTDSSGLVFFDSVRLTAIRPHNEWIPGGLAETYVSTGGRSHTYGTAYGQSLVADLIRDGVTGVKGYVFEPYLSVVARPHILFDAITDGYTLGESYSMASQISLSWMDTIMGDPKFAPYKSSYVPDLEITDGNVTASSAVAVSGALVDVTAAVANPGNFPVENATVSFYAGNPGAGGQLLGNETVSVDYGGLAPASFSWDTTGYSGTIDLCAYADSPDEYYELDEGNNVGCVTVVVDPALSIQLVEGMNFVSLPLVQSKTDPSWVLRSIDGDYDRVVYYDASDAQDHWKSYAVFKTTQDLVALSHTMGFWVNVTAPGGTTLLVGGTYPASTTITLEAGWNMVGYPAGSSRQVLDALAGIPWERVESFDPTANPYRLRALGPSDQMDPGRGVWVRVPARVDWTVAY
jgi:uncharacterized protein (TIGR03790 family)